MFDQDPDQQHDTETVEKTDDRIFCASCGHLVTRGRFRFSKRGGHEHVFFNPAGIVFRVLCFEDAPGAGSVGAPTDHFSWFKGYDWTFALCRGCGDHLGWRYTGDDSPPVFYGLIKPKLTDKPD